MVVGVGHLEHGGEEGQGLGEWLDVVITRSARVGATAHLHEI